MPRRKLALPALLTLLALPFAAAPARADDERARRQAAEHFARAEQAEQAADWKSAVAEYQAAYALSPHASVLYNIARATDKLGDAVGAADYYQRYLDETSAPADAARVARKIATLRDRAGRALLAEAVKAKGGLARLRAVKGFVARGTFTSSIGAEKVEGEFVRTVVGGVRARLEKRLPGGKTEVSVVAPAGVWTRSDDRIVVGQDADARAALWREKDLVLLRTREAGAL